MATSPWALPAEPAIPTVFAIDPNYSYNSSNAGLVGVIIDNASNKRTGAMAQRVSGEVGFDYSPQAFKAIACGDESAPGVECAATAMPVISEQALKDQFTKCACAEFEYLRYLAMLNDHHFWARLVVQRVTQVKEDLKLEPILTAYYVTRLSDDEIKLKGEPWKIGTPMRLESELRKSWSEMRGMWQYMTAAKADGNSWEAMPAVPKTQDGWAFRCRGLAGCSNHHIVQIDDSRIRIVGTGLNGLVIESLNKNQAAFGANVNATVFQ
jgi:hypothetical protein